MRVRFECKNGHKWFENYIDNGGTHKRPKSYEVKLEDVLFPSEKVIYEKMLKELEANKEFYATADPLEKTKSLIKKCNINEREMYSIMKKITSYNK
ncbi:MAG: hypothetical protein PWR27_1909 [Petroclostridium sp.]|jgi:hypothetical protein|nr:hypothetical protein [Petroclostridium sp.]